MCVDGLHGGGHVGAGLHDMREAVEGEEDFRARVFGCGGGGEFGPEGGEDRVGELVVSGAEEGEAGEGEVRLDRDGEGGVWVGDGEGGEEGVGACEAGEEGGGVVGLLVKGGRGARERAVFRVAHCEFLTWRGVSGVLTEACEGIYLRGSGGRPSLSETRGSWLAGA